MDESQSQLSGDGDNWRSSPCPALRLLSHEKRNRVSDDQLRTFLRKEIGATGFLLWWLRRLAREVSTADGFDVDGVRKIFAYDSVYSGVTRHGTNRHALECIYELLDPDHKGGSRRISRLNLRRFAAAIRVSFRKSPIGVIKREFGIMMTTMEWSALIQCFGDADGNRISLREEVHLALIESRLPERNQKRALRLVHLCPGLLAWPGSFFERFDDRELSMASSLIGDATTRCADTD